MLTLRHQELWCPPGQVCASDNRLHWSCLLRLAGSCCDGRQQSDTKKLISNQPPGGHIMQDSLLGCRVCRSVFVRLRLRNSVSWAPPHKAQAWVHNTATLRLIQGFCLRRHFLFTFTINGTCDGVICFILPHNDSGERTIDCSPSICSICPLIQCVIQCHQKRWSARFQWLIFSCNFTAMHQHFYSNSDWLKGHVTITGQNKEIQQQ